MSTAKQPFRASIPWPSLLAVILIPCGIAVAQYSSNFEQPPFNGSPSGIPITGQDGWYVPVVTGGSVDGNVFTYAGNTLQIATNPNGGQQFEGGLGSTVPARAQHMVNFSSGGVWHAEWDCTGRWNNAVGPALNNIGSWSMQPSVAPPFAARYFQQLMSWGGAGNNYQPPLSPPPDHLADFQQFHIHWGYFTAASPTVIAFAVPGPQWLNLPVNNWFRVGVTWNFNSAQILSVSIRNITTNGPTITSNVAALGWFLQGGPNSTNQLPTDIRLFAGGNGDVSAWDNLSVQQLPPPPPNTVPPGQDCWNTECGASRYDFANTPIPADFFNPGSSSFSDSVRLGGGPAPVDTVVQRLGTLTFTPVLPSTAQVPIELVSLHLVSCQPITVRYCNGSPPELWNVQVGLSPTPAPPGTMTVTKTHLNGGTFTSQLFVQPLFTFVRQSDGLTRTLDTAPGTPPMLLNSTGPAPWVHEPTIPLDPPPCGVNFVPGVQDANQGGTCTSTAQCTRDVGHAGGGHTHVTGHVTEACPCGACCNPTTGACTEISSADPAADCAANGGSFKGIGSTCASNDGDSIPDAYETGNCCAGLSCAGSGPCSSPTDPTRADTDGDGLNDGVDPFPCNRCLPLTAPNRPAICDQFDTNGDGDCDNDGICDLCAIQSGLRLDCNRNGVPDNCESVACTCPGDTNGDHVLNGTDVSSFVSDLLAGAGTCADVDGNNTVDNGDIPPFVTRLLSGTPCPP